MVAANELCVKLKNGVSEGTLQNYVAQFGGHIQNRYSNSFSRWRLVRFPLNVQVENLFQTFKSNNLFEYVEYNYAGFPLSEWIPNDSLFNQQWHLKNTGQNGGTIGADIKATQAWEITRGNPNVVLAILDSGIPMIKGTNTLSHLDLDDPNKIILGIDVTNSPDGLRDSSGHGTHIAGIAGAETNNFTGISGVCPDCRLLIVKIARIYENTGIPNDTSSYFLAFDFFDAVNYLIQFKRIYPNYIILFNFSYGLGVRNKPGTPNYPNYLFRLFYETIKNAYNENILGIISAGNDYTQIFYPAAFSKIFLNIIAVTATDNDDNYKWDYSHFDYIDVAAPGINILSTVPNYPYSNYGKLNYDFKKGTSMSAPIVSGIAGLILSLNKDYEPNLVKKIILSATNRFPNFYYDTLFGWGRVDAKTAIDLVKGRPLNCQVINYNNRPKIVWEHNLYDSIGGYKYTFNKYVIYKSVFENNLTFSDYEAIAEVDINTNFYIDYSEYIYPGGTNYRNNKFVKYRVSKKSYDGYESAWSNAAGILVYGNIPQKISINSNEFIVNKNFPNPFNTSTTLAFNIPCDDVITITIYNSLGEILHNQSEYRQAGYNEIILNFENFASGVYYYSIKFREKIHFNKLLLVK